MSWGRARAFYESGLGFEVQWEHRFGPGMPVFAEVTRGDLSLFLTEHAEDCQVGGAAYIIVDDVNRLFQEITERGVHVQDPPAATPWGTLEMSVLDPDGNRLRFSEAQDKAQPPSDDPIAEVAKGKLEKPETLSVIPLRRRPELGAFFKERFEAEWPSWYGPGGRGAAETDLTAMANPEGDLPVGVVALDASGAPIGIAALRARSIGSHEHLTPWATAGYVVPPRRREGIGARLLSGLLIEARRLGFAKVYCSTARAVSLLEREGWSEIETVVHDGELLHIFERTLDSGNRTASHREFVRDYERALGTQQWASVEPLIHEAACVTFSNGARHIGRPAIRRAYEANFSAIESEQYRVTNVEWIHEGLQSATYVFDFTWQGLIDGQLAAGAGRGTAVIVQDAGRWQLIAEQLGPQSH